MRNVTIIGSGRTGRGMLGEQFFSAGGFHLTFADCDPELVARLREQGYYTVEMSDFLTGTSRRVRVEGFDAVDTVRERESYLDALVGSELIATAVFAESFDDVAADLADMVRLRRARGVERPVAVLLGGNFVGLKAYFDRAILAALGTDEADVAFYRDHVALVTSKANRKVTFPDAYGDDRLFLTGDDKPTLVVDDAFPFGEGYDYPAFLERVPNAELSMVEKIWSENLVHCSLGFMAACRGYGTVNEAVADDRVRTLAYYAWLEGRRALEAEYGLPVPGEEAVREMFGKFASPYFRDKISRIVRQPLRKLARNDRFMGPALLCLKHGIMPYFVLRAAAHGFCYTDEGEPQSVELARKVAELGLEGAVHEVCGLDDAVAQERLAAEVLVDAIREIGCPDAGRTRVGEVVA